MSEQTLDSMLSESIDSELSNPHLPRNSSFDVCDLPNNFSNQLISMEKTTNSTPFDSSQFQNSSALPAFSYEKIDTKQSQSSLDPSVLDILTKSILDSSVINQPNLSEDILDTCSTMDIVTTELSDVSTDVKTNFFKSSNKEDKSTSANNLLQMLVDDDISEKAIDQNGLYAYLGQPFSGTINEQNLIIGKPLNKQSNNNSTSYIDSNNFNDSPSTTTISCAESDLCEKDRCMLLECHDKPSQFKNNLSEGAASNNEEIYKDVTVNQLPNSSMSCTIAQLQLLKFKEVCDHEAKLILLQQHCIKMLKNISMAFSVWAVYKNSYMWHSDIIFNSSSLKKLAVYALIFDDVENDCISQYQELQQIINHYPDMSSNKKPENSNLDCNTNHSNVHVVPIFNQLFNQTSYPPSCQVKTFSQFDSNLFASIFAQVNPYTVTQCLLHLDHMRQQHDTLFKGIEDLQPFTATFITTQAVHAAQQPPIQFMKGALTRFKSYAELTNVRNVKRKTNPALMYLVPTNSKQTRNSSNNKYPVYVKSTYPPPVYDSGSSNPFEQYTECNKNIASSNNPHFEDDNSIEEFYSLNPSSPIENQQTDSDKKDNKDFESEGLIKSDSESVVLPRVLRERLNDSSKVKYFASNNTPEMLIPAVLCSPQIQNDNNDSPRRLDPSDNMSDKSSKTVQNPKSLKNSSSNRKSSGSKIYDLPENVEAFRSQVKGVYYDDTSNRWCASWHERRTGKKRSRYFAVKKFGFNNAKSHAMDARLEAEESGECAPTNRA